MLGYLGRSFLNLLLEKVLLWCHALVVVVPSSLLPISSSSFCAQKNCLSSNRLFARVKCMRCARAPRWRYLCHQYRQTYCSLVHLTSEPNASSSIATHRLLVQKIGEDLGVNRVCTSNMLFSLLICEQLSDWYSVMRQDVLTRGGGRLFRKYHSLEEVLRAVYPEHPWHSTKFIEPARTHQGFWNNVLNRRNFLVGLANELNIQQVSWP